MGKKIAIVVGVETYQDKSIPPVPHAENDASEFGAALVQLGFAAGDVHVLVNGSATKTRIESLLRRVVKGVQDSDVLFFFYAGHGFSSAGKNYLTCGDTLYCDLEATSVPLAVQFSAARDSRAGRVAFFLDACESGMLADLDERGILSDLTETELDEFFADAEYCVCFSACSPSESSYSSVHHPHGIWTYHLLEALSGRASAAREKNLVTCTSLQNYLSQAVPRTLRTERTDPVTQRPAFFGAMTREFAIADLSGLLKKARKKPTPFTQVSFLGEQSVSIKSFSGFRKWHRVPDSPTASARKFVGTISEKELSEHIDKARTGLKEAFGYKRTELDSSAADGGGTIITPDFVYEVSILLDPEDTSEAVWHHRVHNISNRERVLSDEFNTHLGSFLDAVEIDLAVPVDVQALIDAIEDDGREGLSCTYPEDAASCSIKLHGLAGELAVTENSIRYRLNRRASVADLVTGIAKARGALGSVKNIPLLE